MTIPKALFLYGKRRETAGVSGHRYRENIFRIFRCRLKCRTPRTCSTPAYVTDRDSRLSPGHGRLRSPPSLRPRLELAHRKISPALPTLQTDALVPIKSPVVI